MRRLSNRFALFALAAVFSLAAQPLAAQAVEAPDRDAVPAAEQTAPATAAPSSEAVATDTPLATDEAARVGIAPVKSTEEANAAARQITTDPTMRWVLIIAIVAVAAALIIAVAD